MNDATSSGINSASAGSGECSGVLSVDTVQSDGAVSDGEGSAA